ncbi:MAG TPA: ATP-binding protein [Thermoanaerobaculia bacterium]|nr:ATP-binding protein [Thermoanaerobaculia bacterium]
MLSRAITTRLPSPEGPRRLVVLTGARQVGKTTLARSLYGERLRYLNLDSPGERERLQGVPAEAWGRVVGPAVLDEVQKAPGLLDKIKWAYDEGELAFSVLLGSSRILLLEQVRETLAGRVFLYELWPLTAGELAAHYGGARPTEPLVAALAADPAGAGGRLRPLLDGVVGPQAGAAQAAIQHSLEWGGLPALLQYAVEERRQWLDAYQATYLERDLADLAQLRDLEAFAHCHRLASLRAGRILSYSELARDAGLPVTTVRRYLRYLELSYQIFHLPAWAGNPALRLVKAPKLVWFDSGVQRALSGEVGGLRGEQYENALIGQILMTVWNMGVRVEASYLRTTGGLEVDLLLERQEGLLAFELKARPRVTPHDATPIERARRIWGDRYRGGIVVYRGQRVVQLSETVFAVPDWLLLGY